MTAKVLFVCIENSCRSQMAEGFARQLGKGVIDPFSAGSKPSGKINPTAIELMKEKGIDLTIQQSKKLDDLPQIEWDVVITMGCGDACPFVRTKKRIDWNISDPKNLPMDEFRSIRELIESKVMNLIHEIK